MLSQHLLGTNFMFSCPQADRSMTPIPVSGALGAGLERFCDVTTNNPQKSLAWSRAKASSPVLPLPQISATAG